MVGKHSIFAFFAGTKMEKLKKNYLDDPKDILEFINMVENGDFPDIEEIEAR